MATQAHKILAIYTGGTIGMQQTPQGLAPKQGYLSTALTQLNLPVHDLIEYAPLIDSSAATPSLWQKLATDIASKRDQYDGFVVIHGTDTLAYTAAALSFLLAFMGKPIIVTGAMLPLGMLEGDAEANLQLAFHWASTKELQQVAVAFGGQLLAGSRIRKQDAEALLAFSTPHVPPLALGTGSLPPLPPPRPYQADPTPFPVVKRVLAIKLYPGCIDWVANALSQEIPDALLLETYGSGNIPRHAKLEAVIQQMLSHGKLVAQVSQCWKGQVSRTYALGNYYAELGVLSAGNMTPEAAFCKLYIASSMPCEIGKNWFTRNQCGEMD